MSLVGDSIQYFLAQFEKSFEYGIAEDREFFFRKDKTNKSTLLKGWKMETRELLTKLAMFRKSEVFVCLQLFTGINIGHI